MRTFKKNRAFTLVELIVVIVVLGILATAATLSYIDVTRVYREEVATANLRAMKSAVPIYRLNHDGDFPDKLISTSGHQDGLDYYLDDELNKVLHDSSFAYQYSLVSDSDKLTLKVTGPNSFYDEIVILK